MERSKLIWWLLIAALLLAIVPPHFIGSDRFATLDEPWWVISGSNYYYALTHGDYSNTIYDYHPAVTTTWVVTAAMLAYFPEYRGFGQGYFDVRKEHFENFLIEHGKQAIGLLRGARLIQSTLIIVLALVSFWLLQKLVERAIALLALVLAVDAPYFLGHARLLNHEGMLAMLVLVCVLGMLVYLKERRLIYLLTSSAAFGLAQLTKSSSIAVTAVIGLMLLIDLFEGKSGQAFGKRLLGTIKVLGVWLAGAAILYVVLWPGMWVAPGKMLYEVYGNAFSYAFQGARLEVAENVEPSAFNAVGVLTYLQRWLLRSTPLSWLGMLWTVPVLTTRSVAPAMKRLIGYLALTALLFILMFGIAKGRDSTHYILSSFVCLDVIAGLGWGYGLLLLAARRPILEKAWARAGVLGALIALQIACILPFYPYYYDYENPLMVGLSGSRPYGYGEGLELAAAYLAEKPDAVASRSFVYAGMGPFSFFYPGHTEVFKKAYLTEPGLPSIIIEMRKADYLVVYSAIQEQQPESEEFLKAMELVEAEKEIIVRRQVYARVYRIADIPENVFAELGNK